MVKRAKHPADGFGDLVVRQFDRTIERINFTPMRFGIFEYADDDDASDQGLSVAWAVSTWSGVAAQLARRFNASSDFEPGSAV